MKTYKTFIAELKEGVVQAAHIFNAKREYDDSEREVKKKEEERKKEEENIALFRSLMNPDTLKFNQRKIDADEARKNKDSSQTNSKKATVISLTKKSNNENK